MSKQDQTVHIIDDDRFFLDYLSEILSSEQYSVITYNSADNFIEKFNDTGVGCLIIDLLLPGINGLDLQKKLIENDIDMPFIMVSGYGDVETAVNAMKAGAIDFLEKPFNPQHFLSRVSKAINHHQQIRQRTNIRSQILKCLEMLTGREKEVMDRVVEGLQNKDIAKQLGISVKTVEVHRANVMEKMHANSIVDLVRMSLIIDDQIKNYYTTDEM